MDEIINVFVTSINDVGRGFCNYAGGMFVQSTVLIAILWIVDRLLRKRVQATWRYWIWMLVFIKLILPPTLSLPTSVGYWCRDWVAMGRPVPLVPTPVPAGEPVAASESTLAGESPQQAPMQLDHETLIPMQSVFAGRVELTWQGAVFSLWWIGIVVLVALLLHRVFFVRALMSQGRPAERPLLEVLARCHRKMGVRQDIGLRLLPSTFSPAVCGLFRPVILLPEALLEKLSHDDLRAVLIHELAHIKRGDLWLNSIQTLLQIAYFYNPFVWLANAIVRRVREQAVDEMVLVALGAGARSYSRTLVDIAETTFFKPNWTLRPVGVAESKKSLEGRIKHMLTMPVPKSARIGLWGTLMIMAIAAVLLPMAKAEQNNSGPSAANGPEESVARLPDGVTLQFVGLGTAPWETEQRWWRPDGTEIGRPKFETVRNRPLHQWPANPNGLQFRCAALMKFSGYLGKGVSVPGVRFTNGMLHSGLVSGIADDGTLLAYVVCAPGPQGIPDTADMSVAVGMGPFKRVESASEGLHEKSHETYWLEGGLVLVRHPLRIGPMDTLTVDLTCPKGDIEYRVTARLKNGQTEQWSGGSVGDQVKFFMATPRRENLTVEDIEQLTIEYRPYQWVTFERISLVPGVKTDVRVRIAPHTTLETPTRLEELGIKMKP